MIFFNLSAKASWKQREKPCKPKLMIYLKISYVHCYGDSQWSQPVAHCNLVPRSHEDEAEVEIWQSKKICFSWLAAPFDSCPIPSLKIDAVFRGKLSSNSSSNLEVSAVGENEKPMRKDERRNDLEVICHSGLNNFCNTIVPLPKSQTRHPARAQAPLHLPHMFFWHKTLQIPPPVRICFCAYEVAQSPHENSMSGANTRSV